MNIDINKYFLTIYDSSPIMVLTSFSMCTWRIRIPKKNYNDLEQMKGKKMPKRLSLLLNSSSFLENE